jgi:hypothetical protein
MHYQSLCLQRQKVNNIPIALICVALQIPVLKLPLNPDFSSTLEVESRPKVTILRTREEA